MFIRNRMKQLEADAESTFRQIHKLREECNHPAYEIKLYSWRPGCIDPKKICVDCHGVIGSPETEEDKTEGEKLMEPYRPAATAHAIIEKEG